MWVEQMRGHSSVGLIVIFSDGPPLQNLWPTNKEAPGSARHRCLGPWETASDVSEFGLDVGDATKMPLPRTREG
jgi:hypothetical protein